MARMQPDVEVRKLRDALLPIDAVIALEGMSWRQILS